MSEKLEMLYEGNCMIEKIKAKIEAAIVKHKANGGKLVQNNWGVFRKNNKYITLDDCCCGLGCLLIDQYDNEDYYKDDKYVFELYPAFAKVLEPNEIIRRQIFGNDSAKILGPFVLGFDGKGNDCENEMYKFGAEMWQRYGTEP